MNGPSTSVDPSGHEPTIRPTAMEVGRWGGGDHAPTRSLSARRSPSHRDLLPQYQAAELPGPFGGEAIAAPPSGPSELYLRASPPRRRGRRAGGPCNGNDGSSHPHRLQSGDAAVEERRSPRQPFPYLCWPRTIPLPVREQPAASAPSTPWSANKAVVQSLFVLVLTQNRSQHNSSTNNRPPIRPQMPLATLRRAPPQRVLAWMSACLGPREVYRRGVVAILSAVTVGPGRSARPTGPSRPSRPRPKGARIMPPTRMSAPHTKGRAVIHGRSSRSAKVDRHQFARGRRARRTYIRPTL